MGITIFYVSDTKHTVVNLPQLTDMLSLYHEENKQNNVYHLYIEFHASPAIEALIPFALALTLSKISFAIVFFPHSAPKVLTMIRNINSLRSLSLSGYKPTYRGRGLKLVKNHAEEIFMG